MKYLIFYNGNNVVLGTHNAPMLESFRHWKYFYRKYKRFHFENEKRFLKVRRFDKPF